jgi:hypothetical protein
MDAIVSKLLFKIYRLEWWWVAFDLPQFYPENRIHLFKKIFWMEMQK